MPGAISFRADIREIDWALCSECLACAEACPSRALEVVGKYRTVDETFRIVERDRDFYESSGGGVTVSGGEALLQWEFVRELLKKCREAGLHTALDTTGYCAWENMRQVLLPHRPGAVRRQAHGPRPPQGEDGRAQRPDLEEPGKGREHDEGLAASARRTGLQRLGAGHAQHGRACGQGRRREGLSPALSRLGEG